MPSVGRAAAAGAAERVGVAPPPSADSHGVTHGRDSAAPAGGVTRHTHAT